MKQLLTIISILLLASCHTTPKTEQEIAKSLPLEINLNNIDKYSNNNVRIINHPDTDTNLIIYSPAFNDIKLSFGNNPELDDSTVFCCAAAFTHSLMTTFDHSNVEGLHYSNGVRYEGYKNRINTGTFLFYDNGNYRFVKTNALSKNDFNNVQTAFQQNLILYNKEVQYPQAFSNGKVKARFRALCEWDGLLVVVECKHAISYSEFVDALVNSVYFNNAIYLDNGGSWDTYWFRMADQRLASFNGNDHPYNSNWLMFRRDNKYSYREVFIIRPNFNSITTGN